MSATPKEIEIPEWWRPGGGISYRRDFLPANHPEQTYNYCKNTLGVKPEEYGIFHPYHQKYKDLTKEQLMSKLAELEEQLSSMHTIMAMM